MHNSDDEGEEEMIYGTDDMQPQEQKNSNHALNLEWCIGFNYELVNGVINLTDDDRKKIFYVSGNTGVIYNFIEDNKT